MGLKLQKDRAGGYRRTWYAIECIHGKHVSRKLKTPLRGKIPLDEDGRFSLDLVGDELFEQSKAAALAELQSKVSDRKESSKKSRETAESLGIRAVRIAEIASENAKRKKYAVVDTETVLKEPDETDAEYVIRLGKARRENKYNQSVSDILTDFSHWCAARPQKKGEKRYHHLTDIDKELVKEYYRVLSDGIPGAKPGEYVRKPSSWQTFRKYYFILKSVFDYFTGGAIANPFVTAYSDFKGKKSDFGTTDAKGTEKQEIAHKPPSPELVRRIWDFATTFKNKPYLSRLVRIDACTALRIGDACNLTWDKVDLKNGVLRNVKTLKTGATVNIPIFDYRPDSPDYNVLLGELRREFEAALAERKDGDVYVIPEAARLYASNPDRIVKEGKMLFAYALQAEAQPEAEEAVLAGEPSPKKKPVEVLAAIENAPFAPAKKERVRQVYELFTLGKSYTQIATLVGKRKSVVSEDLADVERLIGEKIRSGTPHPSNTSGNHLRKVMAVTRSERAQGQRAACLYGWHSFRMFFAAFAFYEIGMSEAELINITGHATVKMVRHYIETAGNAAVMAAKRKNAERNYQLRRQRHLGSPADAAPPHPPAPGGNPMLALANLIQTVLENPELTPEVKNATVAALTAQMTSVLPAPQNPATPPGM